jgi:hypothetical protein
MMSNLNVKFNDTASIGWVKDLVKNVKKKIDEKITSNSIEAKSRM